MLFAGDKVIEAGFPKYQLLNSFTLHPPMPYVPICFSPALRLPKFTTDVTDRDRRYGFDGEG